MSPTSSLRATALCLLLGSSASCGILDADTEVSLRIENSGSIDFDEVTLFTQDGPQLFSDLEAGAATSYFDVSLDYGFASTHILAQGDTLVLQVIDFVGEEPIESGRYTYRLAAIFDGGSGRIEQTLRRD